MLTVTSAVPSGRTSRPWAPVVEELVTKAESVMLNVAVLVPLFSIRALSSAELVIVAAIAVPVLVRQWLATRGDLEANEFVRIFGPIYLIVLAALWISALSDYFAAVNGITADGTPTGSLVYALICFVVAVLAVASNAGATKRSTTSRSSRTPAMGE